MAQGGIGLSFVRPPQAHQLVEPTRDFLKALGISSTKRSIEELGAPLRPTTLHVFVLDSAELAAAFLERFAGRQCEQQLLVVDPRVWEADEAGGRQLQAYTSVVLGSGFARSFFEVLGSKLAKLIHDVGPPSGAQSLERVAAPENA